MGRKPSTMRWSDEDRAIMASLRERMGLDNDSAVVRVAIRYLDQHGPLQAADVEPIEPFVELGGLSVGAGTLLAAGDASGRVRLITLQIGLHEQTRAVAEAALVGGRMMRVVRTDRLGDFVVPIPRSPGSLDPSHGTAFGDTESIRCQEWHLDPRDLSLVIWAGYGPRTRTWVVRTGGSLTGTP